MPSIFSRIIQGEIPCYKIAEDNDFFAFLDINPLSKGHTLVVPKKEIDYIFDLEDKLLGDMNIFAKKIAKAIERVIACNRIAVVVLGLEVPHAHIHLIPMRSEADINFRNPKLKFSNEEFHAIAKQIREALN